MIIRTTRARRGCVARARVYAKITSRRRRIANAYRNVTRRVSSLRSPCIIMRAHYAHTVYAYHTCTRIVKHLLYRACTPRPTYRECRVLMRVCVRCEYLFTIYYYHYDDGRSSVKTGPRPSGDDGGDIIRRRVRVQTYARPRGAATRTFYAPFFYNIFLFFFFFHFPVKPSPHVAH